MPKRFLLTTAFIWIFLGFVIPNSINPNDANIFAELLGVVFIRTLTAILLAGIIELGFVISKSFRSKFSPAGKSEKDQKATETTKVTFPVGSKEWRADSDNIYYQRNLWA